MRFISRNLAFVFALTCAALGQQLVNLDTGTKGSRLPMWSVDSGSANAYVLTTTAILGPTLRTGSHFVFVAANTNTTSSTANVDTTGVIAIKKFSGGVLSNLSAGDITALQVVILWYDGTQYQCVTCGGSGGSGTVTSIATTSPITGGPITTTGTIACATCVTSAAALTSNQLMTGAGSQASQTLGSLGTTTTLLHGNASGAPSFGAVSLSADVSGTLPVANGGTGTGSTLTGLIRGNASAFTAAELSGDATTSGSNAVSVVKVNGGSVPASATALASDSSSKLIAATYQGNGSKVQLSTGSATSGNCVKFDANGNTVDNGAVCGAGGGVLANTTFRRWAYYSENGTGNSSIAETAPDFSGTFGSEIASSTTCGPSRTTVTTASNGSTATLGNTTKKNWKAGKSPSIRMQINVSTTSSVRAWAAAFTDTTMTGSATPGGNWLAFRYDTGAGDTHWNACTSASGTNSCTDTGVSVDTTNCQFFQIDFTSGTNAVFYINGSSVATITSNLPATGTMLGWFAGVTTLTNSAVTFKYSFFYMDESPW